MASACPAQRWLWDTLDTVGGWFCRLSGNAPGQGIEKDPAGLRQDSPGRKPWELWQVRMSALNGRCRPLRLFHVGILGVHVARARALACPARPFQGRSVGDSPGARMRVSSQGLRPGLSCATLSGSSAYSTRASVDRGRLLTVRRPRYASKTYDDRHGSGAAAYCQTSAPHLAFTGNNHAAHGHSLTRGQQPVHRGAKRSHRRGWGRYRCRYRNRLGVDINPEVHGFIKVSNADADCDPDAAPDPEISSLLIVQVCGNHSSPARQSFSGLHGHRL